MVDLSQDKPEPPKDGMCECCHNKHYEEYYDNGVHGASGWLCAECIETAEVEL